MAKDANDRLREKRLRLETELANLRKREHAEAERRHAIAGRAVLDHAVKDPDFAATLMRVLDAELTRRRERKLFALTSLPEPPASSPAPTAPEVADASP